MAMSDLEKTTKEVKGEVDIEAILAALTGGSASTTGPEENNIKEVNNADSEVGSDNIRAELHRKASVWTKESMGKMQKAMDKSYSTLMELQEEFSINMTTNHAHELGERLFRQFQLYHENMRRSVQKSLGRASNVMEDQMNILSRQLEGEVLEQRKAIKVEIDNQREIASVSQKRTRVVLRKEIERLKSLESCLRKDEIRQMQNHHDMQIEKMRQQMKAKEDE